VNFIELKTINTLTKEPRKTIIKKKLTKLESLLLLKAKTIMDKIESHKNFNKRTKDKTKK
jgi:hypothetical protein